MRAMRERLVVSVDLGGQLCLDGVHRVVAVDPPRGRMVDLATYNEREGGLGGPRGTSYSFRTRRRPQC